MVAVAGIGSAVCICAERAAASCTALDTFCVGGTRCMQTQRMALYRWMVNIDILLSVPWALDIPACNTGCNPGGNENETSALAISRHDMGQGMRMAAWQSHRHQM